MTIRCMICDDTAADCAALSAHIARYGEEKGLGFDIGVCCGSEELLSVLERETFDILFLDIEMPGKNGMEAAREIRRTNKGITIIFVTNLIQYALQGYEVQAYRFLHKPVLYPQFTAAMEGIAERLSRLACDEMVIRNKDGYTRIRAHTIEYVETWKGHVRIRLEDGDLECYQSMASMEKMLDDGMFFRCHAAYLINMEKVERLTANEITLTCGERIPVSKHRRRQLAQAMTKFWGGILL